MNFVLKCLPRYKKFFSLFFVFLFGVTFGLSRTSAQVHIAPVALYMNDHKQTGRLVVRNSSDKPQELTVELLFGYPATNKQGNVYLKTFEKVPERALSATEWIRVYPRHLVLPPKQQQTIRFSARPPAGLPAGEYWIRPAISTTNARTIKNNLSERITTHINLIKRTILSLNYRHGNVRTGIEIMSIEAKAKNGKLQLWTKLDRKGNAAYLGHVSVSLYKDGRRLYHDQKEIAVYNRQTRSFNVDKENLSPGQYRAQISFTTTLRARENEAILPAPPVSKSIQFTIK
ncbi:MAG TPA: hypothetical protein VF181_06045 [Balneolaceae bacterium]